MPRQKLHPVDAAVGKRIKARRIELCISQERLGERLGVAYQQIQKYETGINRAGSSVLFDISRLLHVRVGYFFEEIDTAPMEIYPPIYFRTVRALRKIKCNKRLHSICDTAELFAQMQP